MSRPATKELSRFLSDSLFPGRLKAIFGRGRMHSFLEKGHNLGMGFPYLFEDGDWGMVRLCFFFYQHEFVMNRTLAIFP
jgi:hypothetical protein